MPGTHHTAAAHGRTFVVGYDGSAEARNALDLAAHDAGPTGRVFVVVCFDEPPGWMGRPDRDAALVRAESEGRRLVEELEQHAIPSLQVTHWEAELLPGPPPDAILRVAEVRGADEILIGSRGRGRTASLFGSVAQAVLHRADLPVRVITHRAAERLARTPAPTP